MGSASVSRRQPKPSRRTAAPPYQALFERAGVGMAVLSGDGRLLDANPRLCRMLGYDPADLFSRKLEELAHPEDRARASRLIKDMPRGGGDELSIEQRYRRADDSWLWVHVSVTSLNGRTGRERRFMAVIEDIEARHQTEQALRERERLFRNVLDSLPANPAPVDSTTTNSIRAAGVYSGREPQPGSEMLEAEAKASLAERMAVIATLSAGLGHDMANLLVPVHIRLEALSRMDLSDEMHDHLLAIKSSAESLQKLSSGLRLLATDARLRGEHTRLDTWWKETGGILRAALPGSVTLEADLPADVWVAMTRPALMQAVFALVQNAGDALRDRTDGRVLIRAHVDGDHVRVIVADNGPGMTEEVRKRCLEPFFTTKHRSISTGLGLSIVYGLVKEAGGEFDIQSQFGQGSTFAIRLKRGLAPEERVVTPRRAGVVQIEDARLRAIVVLELRSLHYEVTFDCAAAATPDLVVCDRWPLQSEVNARVVLLADGPNIPASAIALGSKPAVQAIRNALRELTAV